MLEKFLKGLGSQAGQDALFLLGATMKDISGGGTDNFMGARQMLAGRQKEADELAAFDALANGLFGGQDAPMTGGQGEDVLAGGAGAGRPAGWSVMDGPQNLRGPDMQGNPGEMGGMTPEMRGWIAALRKGRNLDALLRLYEANQPTYDITSRGIYENRRGQRPTLVEKFPEKERPTPEGAIRDETGRLVEDPGYFDFIAKTAGIRRDAVVDRPMPSRARAGGGRSAGGAPGGLPAGFTLD